MPTDLTVDLSGLSSQMVAFGISGEPPSAWPRMLGGVGGAGGIPAPPIDDLGDYPRTRRMKSPLSMLLAATIRFWPKNG